MPDKAHILADIPDWRIVEDFALRVKGLSYSLPDGGSEIRGWADDVIVIARRNRRKDISELKKNPPVVTYFNPRSTKSVSKNDVIARHVAAIIYMHQQDRQMYVHGFGGEPEMQQSGERLSLSGLSKNSNVLAIAQSDGTVLLRHKDGLSLWGDY